MLGKRTTELTAYRQGRSAALGLARVVVVLLGFGVSMFAAAPSLSERTEGWAEASYGAIDGDSDRGRSIAQSRCAACHGGDGNGTIVQIPKLAGQNSEYLCQRLQAFRSGNDRSDAMAKVVARLSSTDAADVAAYYQSLPVKPDPITDRSLAAKGEHIFFSGSGWMMTRCVMCHDASRNNVMMDRRSMMAWRGSVVNLNGQHAVYVVNQLDRFSNGERTSSIMDPIASSLSEMERKAVAAYLAGMH